MWNTWVMQWTDWWASVPPYFAFLLGLPFAIAAIVFLVDAIRGHFDERSHQKSM